MKNCLTRTVFISERRVIAFTIFKDRIDLYQAGNPAGIFKCKYSYISCNHKPECVSIEFDRSIVILIQVIIIHKS